MSTSQLSPERSAPSPSEPLPENLSSVQPGGGGCFRIELAWGRWRRRLLKRFWPGFVRRMADLRRGSCEGAPHEILDPRDLKYCRNQCTCDWDPADDPFRWRDRLPFARWGLAELQLLGWPLLVAGLAAGWFHWSLALVPGVLLCLVVWFFRDPPRRIPQEPGLVVSPADGKVVEVERLDHEPWIGGPAVRIGIFLSIFNVHINRAPVAGRAIRQRYFPGKFLNAMSSHSAQENENLWIGLEEDRPPYRRLIVRVIAGAIARRIVCGLRPGEKLSRGDKFGMIKLGSRTELILPDAPDLEVEVMPGARVRAGSSVLARFAETA